MVYKVLDSTGSGDDVTIAKRDYVGHRRGPRRIISLSLGGAGYSQAMQSAVNYAWQHNVLVVAAAGNSASSSCSPGRRKLRGRRLSHDSPIISLRFRTSETPSISPRPA